LADNFKKAFDKLSQMIIITGFSQQRKFAGLGGLLWQQRKLKREEK